MSSHREAELVEYLDRGSLIRAFTIRLQNPSNIVKYINILHLPVYDIATSMADLDPRCSHIRQRSIFLIARLREIVYQVNYILYSEKYLMKIRGKFSLVPHKIFVVGIH